MTRRYRATKLRTTLQRRGVKRPPLWTAEEEAFVRDNYNARTCLEMGASLGRTEKAVIQRCHLLGLNTKFRAWSQAEDDFLRTECAPGRLFTLAAVGLRIGRTRNSVSLRLCQLGLSNQRRKRVRQLAGDHPIHGCWSAMRARCLNPSNHAFAYYGGRGITVCERWASFANFVEDMGPKPSSKHSIDRIDNDGNYEPSNCRWATPREQAANRRSSVWITHAGKRMVAAEWARAIGRDRHTIVNAVRRGEDPASAVARLSAPRALPSHCGHGHALAGDNLRITSPRTKSKWRCRACTNQQGARAYEKKVQRRALFLVTDEQ